MKTGFIISLVLVLLVATALLSLRMTHRSVPMASMITSSASIAPTPTRSLRMPLLFSRGKRHVFIYLKINGYKPLPFLLDTGCSAPLLVDDWAVKKLHLKKTSEFDIVEPGSKKLLHADVQSVCLVSSDAEQPIVPTDIKSVACEEDNSFVLPSGERSAGTLGMPIFEHGVFSFDFSSRALIFSPNGVTPAPNAVFASHETSVTLPLIQPDQTVAQYFVRLKINQQTYDFLLDTGAEPSVIPKAMLSNFQGAYPLAALFHSTGRNTAWSSFNETVLVRNFRLKALSIPFVYFNVTNTSDDLSTPVVGMNLLTHFVLTLDVKDKTLTLVSRDLAPQVFSPQRSRNGRDFLRSSAGFTLGTKEDRPSWGNKSGRLPQALSLDFNARNEAPTSNTCSNTFVDNLIPNSPAARGGLRDGDEILTINGQPAAKVSPLNFYDAAIGLIFARDVIDPRLMRLRLLRDGKLLTREFVTSDDMDKTTYLPLGFRCITLRNHHLRLLLVTAILSGSTADKAGLRVLDSIVGINGVSLEEKVWTGIRGSLVPTPGQRLTLNIMRLPEAKLYRGHTLTVKMNAQDHKSITIIGK